MDPSLKERNGSTRNIGAAINDSYVLGNIACDKRFEE